MSETYEAKLGCDNCGNSWSLTMEKGNIFQSIGRMEGKISYYSFFATEEELQAIENQLLSKNVNANDLWRSKFYGRKIICEKCGSIRHIYNMFSNVNK